MTGPNHTPNASLPPLGEGERREIVVKIKVPCDWEKRLDMQWVVEREIHADRWNWEWPRIIADDQKQIETLAAEYIAWNNLESDSASVDVMNKFAAWAKTRLCVQTL